LALKTAANPILFASDLRSTIDSSNRQPLSCRLTAIHAEHPPTAIEDLIT
jgi:hypothetical protein